MPKLEGKKVALEHCKECAFPHIVFYNLYDDHSETAIYGLENPMGVLMFAQFLLKSIDINPNDNSVSFNINNLDKAVGYTAKSQHDDTSTRDDP